MDLRDRRDQDDQSERVLIASTADTQTAAVARALANDLANDDLIVELADLDRGIAPPPVDYEAVVIASRVRLGRLAVAYVDAYHHTLSDMPGFLISVSRGTRSTRAIDRMIGRTGWQPTLSVTFGRSGWRARWSGDHRPAPAESHRIHELALAIADEVPVIEMAT